MVRKILVMTLCGLAVTGAAPVEKPEPAAPPLAPVPWTFYVHSSPIADLALRPNVGGQFLRERFALGFKASWFHGASQVFDYLLDTEDYGQVQAHGFEIGPQLGYVLSMPGWSAYIMPRLGIYRSIVHYECESSGCKKNSAGETRLAPNVNGWVVEAMAMLHVPVTGPIHFEVGAGFSGKLLVELNAGLAF